MSERLNNKRCCDFCTGPLQQPPIKCIPQVRSYFIGCTRSSHSAISADLPLFLQRVKKVRNLASISTPLFFEPPSSRNEATNCYQSFAFGVAMTELCSLQICCSLDPDHIVLGGLKGCLHYDTCTPYMYVVQVYGVHVS